jgi:hypothetical protein
MLPCEICSLFKPANPAGRNSANPAKTQVSTMVGRRLINQKGATCPRALRQSFHVCTIGAVLHCSTGRPTLHHVCTRDYDSNLRSTCWGRREWPRKDTSNGMGEHLEARSRDRLS